jgi:phosphinothricin acetyltransferase
MAADGIVRDAVAGDCEAIAEIYNEGIAEGRSTFETQPRSADDIRAWLDSAGHPLLVAERAGAVVGWARISPYSTRPCYAGIGEASVYICGAARGHGLGGELAGVLRERAEHAGFYKLLGKLFAENSASARLAAGHGFREVGLHVRHGRIGGEWRDVLVVELLLGSAAN